MEPVRLFWEFLNQFIVLSEGEFNTTILPHVEVRHFKKKQIVSQVGEVENYINFLAKGLVRKYFNKEGEEIITQISKEGEIIHLQESFYQRTPSTFCMEAIEFSTLVSIRYNELNIIYSSSAVMEKLGRLIVTNMMILSESWQIVLLKFSPRERFLYFVQNNSELMQRVPQKFLASLLNIQPETFSRFKHLLKSPPTPQRGSG